MALNQAGAQVNFLGSIARSMVSLYEVLLCGIVSSPSCVTTTVLAKLNQLGTTLSRVACLGSSRL